MVASRLGTRRLRVRDALSRQVHVNNAIARLRLRNQYLTQPAPIDPGRTVAWFGAVQAQDYGAAKWALGVRMPGSTDAAVERAFNDGEILRTHVMRPTWHFVAPSDIHWMLELTAPRVHRALAYGNRQLELDPKTRVRAAKVFERSLAGVPCLTRAELGARLARARIAAKGVRLALLTIYAELEGVICSGPRRGAQFTYALLAERAPATRRLPRDQAIAELTRRYFQSHGPATIRDCVWCTGLTTTDVKRGLDINRAQSMVEDGLMYWTVGEVHALRDRGSIVHLLPIYDEYLVAYRDLIAVPRGTASFGILPQAVVVDGQVAATWKATRAPDSVLVQVRAVDRLTTRVRRALDDAVGGYSRFLNAPVSVALG
ncbi:MAG TPA: winged helix DNA-binding domain-containing protein [Vicinamibacterales bacterium]|nr:winged helix DNA-binding domain-containing protein [Vicinamibacterales bacterium]